MKRIIKIEKYFVVTMLVLLILLVFFSAVFRWFGVSIAWSVDTAQMLFAWVCFIGSDLALRQNKHVGINMLTQHFPPAVQNGLALALNIIMLAFCCLTVVFGTNLAIVNYKRMFNTLPISYSLVTSAGPVGCALMASTFIRRIIQNVHNIKAKDYSQIHFMQVDEDIKEECKA